MVCAIIWYIQHFIYFFQTCERILLELYTHEKSTVFHEPVSKAVSKHVNNEEKQF